MLPYSIMIERKKHYFHEESVKGNINRDGKRFFFIFKLYSLEQ